MTPVVRSRGEGSWDGIRAEVYKERGDTFRDVTRQLLFGREAGLACDLRYFEIGPGGHTTLERHEHAHAVVVLRGRGRVLVGSEIREIRPYDLVHVPPMTWHQFRAGADEPLGFLCLADAGRDHPQRPTEAELASLRDQEEIAAFLRV